MNKMDFKKHILKRRKVLKELEKLVIERMHINEEIKIHR